MTAFSTYSMAFQDMRFVFFNCKRKVVMPVGFGVATAPSFVFPGNYNTPQKLDRGIRGMR
jgi:hypothetical protein